MSQSSNKSKEENPSPRLQIEDDGPLNNSPPRNIHPDPFSNLEGESEIFRFALRYGEIQARHMSEGYKHCFDRLEKVSKESNKQLCQILAATMDGKRRVRLPVNSFMNHEVIERTQVCSIGQKTDATAGDDLNESKTILPPPAGNKLITYGKRKAENYAGNNGFGILFLFWGFDREE